jgi:hypothetical protein
VIRGPLTVLGRGAWNQLKLEQPIQRGKELGRNRPFVAGATE